MNIILILAKVKKKKNYTQLVGSIFGTYINENSDKYTKNVIL